MSGVDDPSLTPKLLCSFNSQTALQQYAKGCDEDIGGYSTMNLTLDESGPTPVGKFWGKMKLNVRPELQGKIRTGYAGFRSMVSSAIRSCIRESLINIAAPNDTFWWNDARPILPRILGSPSPLTRITRTTEFIFCQYTNGRVCHDRFVATPTILSKRRWGMGGCLCDYLFRSELSLQPIFTAVGFQIPFRSFVLTNQGEVIPNQAEMLRERMRTIGISLLGGNSGVEGSYELWIDNIKAINLNHSTQTRCERCAFLWTFGCWLIF